MNDTMHDPAEMAEDAQPEVNPQEAFAALGLTDVTLRAVAALGYGAPTPIQAQTIPILLAGRDLIAQAPTGTGKTAAYGLPIVEHLDPELLAPQALIVCPTRELAMQVSEALNTFGKYRQMVTLPIYGGAPYERQIRALARGVQVVIGTPGRLLDHLRRETLKLGDIKMVVLDEGDEMLNMGFIEDIETLLAALPADRQSALFSATVPPRIASLAERYLRNPAHVHVEPRVTTAPKVRQVYYEVPFFAKPDALARILDHEEPQSVIVFVRTRQDADEVAERLNALGYLAQPIHGEIPQAQRERTLARFRAGGTQILVATDVAARGLDIPDVSHIINYDLPMDAESYVHRIGRTGRAGKEGEALTLVTPREQRQLRALEKTIRHRLQRLRVPTPADVAARRREGFREDVLKILDAGELDAFLALVEDLAGSREPMEIAAAAFKMAAQAREAAHPGTGINWVTMPPAPPEPEPAPMADASARPPLRPRPHREDEHFEESEPRPKKRTAARRDGMAASSDAGQMVRLFMRVGRTHGVRPSDIVGAIANEANVPGDEIGDIDIYDTFSFVEIPSRYADTVIGALSRATIRNQRPRARLALPDDRLGESAEDARDMNLSGIHDMARLSRAPAPRGRPERPMPGRPAPSRPSFSRPPVNRPPAGRGPAGPGIRPLHPAERRKANKATKSVRVDRFSREDS
jgi:ATP-dependent RNA helicase DeaD